MNKKYYIANKFVCNRKIDYIYICKNILVIFTL